eukprot:12607-Rhodomonas_salina.4
MPLPVALWRVSARRSSDERPSSLALQHRAGGTQARAPSPKKEGGSGVVLPAGQHRLWPQQALVFRLLPPVEPALPQVRELSLSAAASLLRWAPRSRVLENRSVLLLLTMMAVVMMRMRMRMRMRTMTGRRERKTVMARVVQRACVRINTRAALGCVIAPPRVRAAGWPPCRCIIQPSQQRAHMHLLLHHRFQPRCSRRLQVCSRLVLVRDVAHILLRVLLPQLPALRECDSPQRTRLGRRRVGCRRLVPVRGQRNVRPGVWVHDGRVPWHMQDLAEETHVNTTARVETVGGVKTEQVSSASCCVDSKCSVLQTV